MTWASQRGRMRVEDEHQSSSCLLTHGDKPHRGRLLGSELAGGWRASASVESHRSGTMVYEEKCGSGIDTPEVHRRV